MIFHANYILALYKSIQYQTTVLKAGVKTCEGRKAGPMRRKLLYRVNVIQILGKIFLVRGLPVCWEKKGIIRPFMRSNKNICILWQDEIDSKTC